MSEPEPIYADQPARERALHLGMWIFLGSETLLFAGLFGLYAAYRETYHHDFTIGIEHNEILIGTANTVVLIVSSFFVAWAVHSLRHNRTRACVGSLMTALVLGGVFLVLKSIEYSAHLADGIAPGVYYSSVELPSQGSRMFFTLYYAMTGLHGLHVIAGMVILAWLALRVHRRRTNVARHPELELGGLYWHLVDVVWIFLWPLLYLAD